MIIASSTYRITHETVINKILFEQYSIILATCKSKTTSVMRENMKGLKSRQSVKNAISLSSHLQFKLKAEGNINRKFSLAIKRPTNQANFLQGRIKTER